jgi:hypothetical protein
VAIHALRTDAPGVHVSVVWARAPPQWWALVALALPAGLRGVLVSACDICDWKKSTIRSIYLATRQGRRIRLCELCHERFAAWFDRRRRFMKYDVRSGKSVAKGERHP